MTKSLLITSRRSRAFIRKRFSLGQRRCAYCCRQLNFAKGHKNSVTMEHIVPKSKGGTLAIPNKLMVCCSCNSERGDTDFVEYVTKKGFPRQEWLKRKYEEAVAYTNELRRVR